MRKVLVALDTDHIKRYVFGTNKLNEIRGASSLLDYLNRIVMKELPRTKTFEEKQIIYANGGSGLFLIDEDEAHNFGKAVQKAFRDETGGSASITYIVQELPEDVPDTIDGILEYPLRSTLELMRYRLREAKDCPPELVALPSHPFMRTCDACGVEYVNPEGESEEEEPDPDEEPDLDEDDALYCASCQKKHNRDLKVKGLIRHIIKNTRYKPTYDDYLWHKVISRLLEMKYDLPRKTQRPQDFDAFRNFKGTKDYLGLIYADANSMGKKVEECDTLAKLAKFANDVDEAIYEAVCVAIATHLKIRDHLKSPIEVAGELKNSIFPFDILLLGGDDVLMVTSASVAMDVALAIAEEFHKVMKEKTLEDKDPTRDQEYTLSVGVVLAPVKYPFGLLRDLAESTLRFAKTEGAKQKASSKKDSVKNENGNPESKFGDTRINFMTVTGSTSLDFPKVYSFLRDKPKQAGREDIEFYATLRPYDVEQLTELLNKIREGHTKGLGRTKLHQMREAILKKNLTTSVQEALMVLRNWKEKQRVFMVDQVYKKGGQYQQQYSDPQNLATMFPRVIFPWFADGKDTYRTNLLDFVELYDFVAGEEVDSAD